MADPLSITLATVTLVTALKDIVELGDKIQDLFAKVPNNLRKSQKLAQEISETLHELKEFCEEHTRILESKSGMMKALEKLQRKLKEVHRHCMHLIPPSSEKYIGHFKVIIYLWQHGGRIETEISELQKVVDDCYTKCTMFASLRTEVQAHNILNAVLNLGVSDGDIQSFYTPKITISKPLSDMDEHMAANIHLKVQVDKVSKFLNKFFIDFIISNVNKPNITSISPPQIFYAMDTYYCSNRSSLYQSSVQHTFPIQDLFQSSCLSSIIKQGIYYLGILSLQLYVLDMDKEAAHMQLWVVQLHRSLVSQDHQNYVPYLINNLRKLSTYYCWSDNIEGAYNTIKECVALSQQLQTPSASLETKLWHAEALTELYHVLNLMGNSDQSSIIIQEAIKAYENAFQVDSGWKNDEMNDISDNTNLSLKWWSHCTIHAEIHEYALALHSLAEHLQCQGSIQDSFNAEMKALSILHNIVILHPDSSADLEIGDILYNLLGRDFSHLISMDQSLLYAEQCTVIQNKYAELNPTLFGKSLCRILRHKSSILWSMKKYEEALASINEAAKLAPCFVNDEGFITRIQETAVWYLEAISNH